MSASDHINEQLKMFMSGTEIRETITMTGDNPHHTVERVMTDKANAAFNSRVPGVPTLHESIKAEGVRNPVQLIHTDDNLVLGQGHHRVAVASDLEYYDKKETLVPVVHTDARKGTGLEGADDPDDPVARRRATNLSDNPYGPLGPGALPRDRISRYNHIFDLSTSSDLDDYEDY